MWTVFLIVQSGYLIQTAKQARHTARLLCCLFYLSSYIRNYRFIPLAPPAAILQTIPSISAWQSVTCPTDGPAGNQ